MRRLVVALLWAVCGCGAASGAPQATESPSATETSASGGDDRMFRHFLDATAARDAVIAGHLEGVRKPLLHLAASDIGPGTPDDWRPWIEEMQAEARRGAESKTLAQAAQAVARLGTTCGECHRTTHGGPRWAGDERGYQHEGETGLEEKMRRHLWSAEELWLGLTGPRHQAWSRGAAALMNIHVPGVVDERGVPATIERRPTGEGGLQEAEPPPGTAAAQPVVRENETAAQGEPRMTETSKARILRDPVDLDAALRALRELGQQADRARAPDEKEAVFGEIISRCGACHVKLGIRIH